MGFIFLIIGCFIIYFMLRFKNNKIDMKEDSMYDILNKIGLWVIAIAWLIAGIVVIIKDIIHFLVSNTL